MTLFSKKKSSKEKNVKFVGVWLPPQINEYLTLYSLVTEIPKTTIIENLIKTWKQEQMENFTEAELLKELSQKALFNFQTVKRKRKIGFNRFILEMDTELQKKGICIEFINKLKIEIKKLNGTY